MLGGVRTTMKLRLSILLITPALLTGCIVLPVPHVTKKSPRTLGRVVDAETGASVDGAVVQLTTVGGWNRKPRPGPRATTAADGSFSFGSRYNFHIALYANVSWALHFPPGSYWEGKGLVTREGYEPLSFYFAERWRARDRDRSWVHVGDLRIARTQPTAAPPNKSLQPTPGSGGRSAARFTYLAPAWLSFYR